MPDELIRRAKRAELEALIDEHGTGAEQATFAWSALTGITLSQLAAAAAGTPLTSAIPKSARDQELVARITRRISMRRRLGLDAVDCIAGLEAACDCLGAALDELDEDASKRQVLAAARKLHRVRHPRFKPQPVPAGPSRAARGASEAHDSARARHEAVTQTNTRPRTRVVSRRRRRWYDDDGDGGAFEFSRTNF
jgi:hypothetical protein